MLMGVPHYRKQVAVAQLWTRLDLNSPLSTLRPREHAVSHIVSRFTPARFNRQELTLSGALPPVWGCVIRRCFAVSELKNESPYELHFERTVFFGGSVRAAPDLSIPAGPATSYWSCGPGAALADRVRGTIGAVVYRVGDDVAELLLCVHLTRLGG